jgi:hypothetical protein
MVLQGDERSFYLSLRVVSFQLFKQIRPICSIRIYEYAIGLQSTRVQTVRELRVLSRLLLLLDFLTM